MKKLNNFKTGFLLIMITSLFIFGCNPPPKNVTDEIANANVNFMEAFANGDATALAENYTLNAKLFPPNGDVIEGRKAIEGFWGAVMNMGIKKAELETVYAESRGNSALEEGRYKLYVSGGQMVDQGKYIVSWKKEDGKWKLNRDIWNTNNPAPVARAAANDTVWIIQNIIKANKISQFEDFNFNYLEPAAENKDMAARNSVRMLKPTAPNKDGTYTYYYIMDPVLPGTNYDMEYYLESKYGKEKANEYYKMFSDCLTRPQIMQVVTQTSW